MRSNAGPGAWLAGFALSCSAMACGRSVGVTVTLPDGAMVPADDDGALPTRPDGRPWIDVDTGLIDAGRRDAATLADGARVDAGRTDVIVPADVPRLPDGALPSLAGAWRIQRMDFPPGSGISAILDEDTPLDIHGLRVNARATGLLLLEDASLSLSQGILVNGHFSVREEAMQTSDGLQAWSYGAPGTLHTDRFLYPGGRDGVTFQRESDGTITQVDTNSGLRTRWTRVSLPVGWPAPATQGAAQWLDRTGIPRVSFRGRARVALAWDLASTAFRTTDDVPIVFDRFEVGAYTLNLPASPPDWAWQIVRNDAGQGTRLAVCTLLAYDDRDNSGTYDPSSTDVRRGQTQFVLVYAPPDVDLDVLAGTAFRRVKPGTQWLLVQADYATRSLSLAPLSAVRSEPPDLTLDGSGPDDVPLPDLVP